MFKKLASTTMDGCNAPTHIHAVLEAWYSAAIQLV
jgi:hypothetical protein